MATKRDNVVDPNQKARWGFTVKDGKVVVGEQTVEETGGVETIRSTDHEVKDSRRNGNGTKGVKSDT